MRGVLLRIKLIACIVLLHLHHMLPAQERTKPGDYFLGDEEKLEMVVHIWGEVKEPGEFRVSYETNVVELISKAGGPTEFANLSKIRLTRELESLNLNEDALKSLVAQ